MTNAEEAGKVATTAIDALRQNPLCLAVVVLTIVLSIIAYYRESSTVHDRTQVITTLIERCMEPSKR